MEFRRIARLTSALLIAFVLITVTNSVPSYLGPLEPLVVSNQILFIGISLIIIASLFLWRSGQWLGLQSRGRALLEFVEAGILLVAMTAFFGLGLSPFNMCLGGGGGFTCYANTQGFLRGLLDLLCIVLGEELFFVGYVTRELN